MIHSNLHLLHPIFSKFIFPCFCPCIFCLSVKRECSGIGEMWMGHSAMLIPLARCIEPGCNWNNQHHCHRHNHHHHQHRYHHHPHRYHHQQNIIIDSISNHQNHSKSALSSFHIVIDWREISKLWKFLKGRAFNGSGVFFGKVYIITFGMSEHFSFRTWE